MKQTQSEKLATLIALMKTELELMQGTQKFVSEKTNDVYYAGSKCIADLSVRSLQNLLEYAERA
jgi:hypothetical protein